MPIPCLLALHKVPLLSLTITNLIGNSDNELVAIHSEAENLEELNREINQYKAKVVLLENSNPLAGEASLAQLLPLHPKLFVIVIQVENNWLHIYCKVNKLLNSTADLLDIIHAAHHHPLTNPKKEDL